ncbi:MAG: M23 family metallopeptidase [Nitrososphaerota archaeon]
MPGQRIYATHDGIAHVFTGTKPPNNLADRVVTVASSRYITKYQHLLKWCVRDGANVTRGTLIGLMDSTGVSTGNHLHYEIRKPSGAQVSLEEINNLVPPYSLGQIVTTAYSGGNESNCYAP